MRAMRASRVRNPLLLCALVGLGPACDDTPLQERRVRLAVRSLAAAPRRAAPGELAKVVGHGEAALMDIEQVYQGADLEGRRRLVQALHRIGSSEALPLLRFLARHDEDPEVRRRSLQAMRALGASPLPAAAVPGDSSQPSKKKH